MNDSRRVAMIGLSVCKENNLTPSLTMVSFGCGSTAFMIAASAAEQPWMSPMAMVRPAISDSSSFAIPRGYR